MAAHVVNKLPEGGDWMYEVKFDGYRALILKDGDNVRIRSRNDKDLTNAYSSVVAAGQRLKATQAVVDGEIVAIDSRGHPSFQALQHRAAHPDHVIVFYAFDLLHLDGIDLTTATLEERRARLPKVVDKSASFSRLNYREHRSRSSKR
jgi:bifunctional non-homologous end joining protein LigD